MPPDQDPPLVSIIVRSMGRASLAQALDSIAAQSYPRIGVVVVNALGRDHPPLAQHCGRFPLKTVGHGGGGPLMRSDAANLGLDEAQGEYLMFLDDDDRIHPGHVARLVEAVQDARAPARVAYAGVEVADADGKVLDVYDYPYDRSYLLGKNFLPIHAVLFSRTLIEAGCRFDPDLAVYEDWDFWLQLSAHCDFRHVPGVSAIYRADLGDSGLSLNAREELRRQGRAKVFEKWRHRWTGADFEELVVFREREQERLLGEWRGAEYQRQAWQNRAAIAEAGLEQSRQRLADSEQRLAESRQQLGEMRQNVAEVRQQLAEAAQRAAAAEQAAASLRGALDENFGHIRALRASLEQMQASRSWRITAPMRAVAICAREVWGAIRFLGRVIPRMNGERWASAARLLAQGESRLLWQRLGALIEAEGAVRVAPQETMPRFIENLHWGDFAAAPLSEPVAIVIPFYNGRLLLERLFATLLAHTDARHRVVLVDDASSDPEIQPLVEAFLGRRQGALLLRNEANRGFVVSANRGIRAAQGDVVIVNSDVEVPPQWLERLIAPMLADRRIASATPMTNAGTICSFPRFCEDNSLPEGWNCEDIDTQFRRLRIDPVPIPTGVGFCMAMSRNAIDEIGAFDEEAYGRGYGEENDWCMRAAAAGFVHVAVPNLFVYHKHGGTFPSEEKLALYSANQRTLHRRFPEYPRLIEAFIRLDPLRDARDLALLLAMCHLAPSRPLLVIDHGLGGGANTYRTRFVTQQRAVRPVIILIEDYHRRETVVCAVFKDWQVEFRAGSVAGAACVLARLPLGEIFYNDAVSFKDPLGLTDVLLELKQGTGAELTVAFHDFFPICPSFTLLDAGSRYCGVPAQSVCDACLPRNPVEFLALPTPAIARWRTAWGRVLGAARRILCFSENSADIVRRAYPDAADRIEVVPHAVLPVAAGRRISADFSQGLHIGVVGAINVQKGARVVADLAGILAAKRPDIRLSVLGEFHCPDRPLPANLHVTGRYRPEDLYRRLLELGVNVVLFPSIWPETFSYVTSEIMQLELPLCCFDLGASADRVRSYRWGRVVEEIGASEALAAILALAEDYERNASAERRGPGELRNQATS